MHPFNDRYGEGASFLTAAAFQAVRGIGFQSLIVGADCGRDLFLHPCQVSKLVYHGNVNSGRAGSAVTAVGALSCSIGMLLSLIHI